MKNLIEQEIGAMKLRKPTNKKAIQKLQQLLDKDVHTKQDFVSTATVVTRKEYLLLYPDAKLHKKCINVIDYIAGHHLQTLTVKDTTKYLLNYSGKGMGDRSSSREDMESILYSRHI